MPMSGLAVAIRIKLDYEVFQGLLDKLCDLFAVDAATKKIIDGKKQQGRPPSDGAGGTMLNGALIPNKNGNLSPDLLQGLSLDEQRKMQQMIAAQQAALLAKNANNKMAANEQARKDNADEIARKGILCPICLHIDCRCKFHTYKPAGWADRDNDGTGGDGGSGGDNGNGDGSGGDNGDNGSGGDGGDDGSGGDSKDDSVPGVPDMNQLMKDVEDAGKRFMLKMANEFDIEFQTMSTFIPCRNVFTGIVAGTLKFEFDPSMPILNPLELALKVVVYWSLMILPLATACVGQVVMLCLNTAYTILAPMAMELLQIAMDGNDNMFIKSCECVIKHVKNIKFIVTEIMANGAPVTVTTSVM